jgi:hypothetical protein
MQIGNENMPQSAITYAWRCLACESTNSAKANFCIACGCPAEATVQEIREHRSRGTDTAEETLEHKAERKIFETERSAKIRRKLDYFAYVLIWLGTFFRCYIVSKDGNLLLVLGWMMAGGWVSWMVWALANKRDIPAMGPFNYGSNEGGRVLYVVGFLILYVVGCFYG